MNPGRFLEHDFEELIRLYDADGDEAVKISDLRCYRLDLSTNAFEVSSFLGSSKRFVR